MARLRMKKRKEKHGKHAVFFSVCQKTTQTPLFLV